MPNLLKTGTVRMKWSNWARFALIGILLIAGMFAMSSKIDAAEAADFTEDVAEFAAQKTFAEAFLQALGANLAALLVKLLTMTLVGLIFWHLSKQGLVTVSLRGP